MSEHKKTKREIIVLSKIMKKGGVRQRVFIRSQCLLDEFSYDDTSPFTPYLDDAYSYITQDAAFAHRANLMTCSRNPDSFKKLQITLVGQQTKK